MDPESSNPNPPAPELAAAADAGEMPQPVAEPTPTVAPAPRVEPPRGPTPRPAVIPTPITEPATEPPGEPARTKSQIKAAAIADGLAVKVKWKSLIEQARVVWDKLYVEELAKVDGDFHRLAGLVQMRYSISREDANSQVKELFAQHYAAA